MNARHLLVSALFPLLAGAGSAAAQNTAAPYAPVLAKVRAVLDAVGKPDTAAFNRALGSDFVFVNTGGAILWERAKASSGILQCSPGQWTIENPATTRVGNDLVVLTYTSSGDVTCGGQKLPSPIYSMSVWQMRGGKWVAVAHSETPAAPKQ